MDAHSREAAGAAAGMADTYGTAAIRLPAAFFVDHSERSMMPYRTPIRRTDRFVWVAIDDPMLDDLLADAREYARPNAFGPGMRNLARSAASTVRLIEEARRVKQ